MIFKKNPTAYFLAYDQIDVTPEGIRFTLKDIVSSYAWGEIESVAERRYLKTPNKSTLRYGPQFDKAVLIKTNSQKTYRIRIDDFAPHILDGEIFLAEIKRYFRVRDGGIDMIRWIGYVAFVTVLSIVFGGLLIWMGLYFIDH